MERSITTIKSPRLPTQDPQFWQDYSIAEKYFYIVLCRLIKKYGNVNGRVVGHDVTKVDGVPPFDSFGISQRICKSARKKLVDGGWIIIKHIYGDRGHRIGTEYSLSEVAFHEDPKEIHALILNKRTLELSTPAEISGGVRLISP